MQTLHSLLSTTPLPATVLIRADLNVPMNGTEITDTSRLLAVVPTIRALSQAGARVILLAHLGRPKGVDPLLSLAPVAAKLEEILGQPVQFKTDILDPALPQQLKNLPAGSLICLENLRYYPEEEANDAAFAQILAQFGEAYVNDAFSCAHRAHASTAGITAYLPSYAGLSLMAEVEALTHTLENPPRPLTAIVGGSKVSTKIKILKSLLNKADTLVIGGAMANTFLAAQGVAVGASKTEPDFFPHALALLNQAAALGKTILLPSDALVATSLTAHARTCNIADIQPDEIIFDIGPNTIARILQTLNESASCVWNGPLGACEHPPFHTATTAISHALSHLTQNGRMLSLAGGGDTAAALKATETPQNPLHLSYLSLAGGAFLEWIEDPTLPGLTALTSKP